MTLWTDDRLDAGFELANEEPRRGRGADLVGRSRPG